MNDTQTKTIRAAFNQVINELERQAVSMWAAPLPLGEDPNEAYDLQCEVNRLRDLRDRVCGPWDGLMESVRDPKPITWDDLTNMAEAMAKALAVVGRDLFPEGTVVSVSSTPSTCYRFVASATVKPEPVDPLALKRLMLAISTPPSLIERMEKCRQKAWKAIWDAAWSEPEPDDPIPHGVPYYLDSRLEPKPEPESTWGVVGATVVVPKEDYDSWSADLNAFADRLGVNVQICLSRRPTAIAKVLFDMEREAGPDAPSDILDVVIPVEFLVATVLNSDVDTGNYVEALREVALTQAKLLGDFEDHVAHTRRQA